MADTTQPAGALPEPIHERCKFASGGARCAKHCGDAVCLPPEIVDTVVLARLNASIAWMMEGKSAGPLGCIGVGDMKRLVALMAERDAAREELSGLRAEMAKRNKSPSDRLHNLCAALEEDADESPFSREAWEQLEAEAAALRRELEELRRKTDIARDALDHYQHGGSEYRKIAARALEAMGRPIPSDAREGREPLTEEQVWRDDGLMEANAIAGLPLDQFMTVVRAVEAAHRIGPVGTSADGETQP